MMAEFSLARETGGSADQLCEGRFRGQADVRRDQPRAKLAGQLDVEGIAEADVVPPSPGASQQPRQPMALDGGGGKAGERLVDTAFRQGARAAQAAQSREDLRVEVRWRMHLVCPRLLLNALPERGVTQNLDVSRGVDNLQGSKPLMRR
jgi:hypothetical protein